MPGRRYARGIAAAAFVAAFLAVQLAIPAIQLFAERPARFGWHMYSGLPSLPDAWAVTADGTASPLDVRGRFAMTRAEVDYAAVLRTALCGTDGVASVRVAYPNREPETLPCD